MAEFEKLIEKAIADNEIPGCVLHAINRDGSFKYAKTFGKRSVNPDSDQSPLQFDTIMWVASCTKLMTSISALQLVERGLITLDEPIYKYIPELKDFPIIEGFKEDGSPIEVPHKIPITLRTLLTHSSGLSYSVMHPKLVAWTQYHGKESNMSGKLLERFTHPMIFEPGTSWMYGSSIDFAGLLIERISGLSLEDFMKQNLWEPLGIKNMTFSLSRRPDLKAKMAEMSFRDEKTKKMRSNTDPLPYMNESGGDVEDCMGGQGVFTSAEEYMKVLHAMLTTDENEKILKKETTELFFTPQLSEGALEMMNMVLMDDIANNAMGGTPKDLKKDWGLGGLLLMGDAPDGKKEGTMIWGGLPNLIWFIDRKTGLTGLYAGQVLPTGDAVCASLDRRFEAAMYEQYAKSRT